MNRPPPAAALLPEIVAPRTVEAAEALMRAMPPPSLRSAWLPLTVLLASVRDPAPCRMPPALPFNDVLPLTVERSIVVTPTEDRPPPELEAVLKVIFVFLIVLEVARVNRPPPWPLARLPVIVLFVTVRSVTPAAA